MTVKPLVDTWGFAGHEAEPHPEPRFAPAIRRLPARPYPGRQAREGRSPRTARFQLDRQGLYGRSGRGPHGALRREELSGGDRRRMPLPGCQQQRHSLADRHRNSLRRQYVRRRLSHRTYPHERRRPGHFGNYRRFYRDAAGNKISHTIDPTTGRSVTSRLLSATVVADNCAEADAWRPCI